MIQTNLIIAQKQTHRHRKQIYAYERGKNMQRDGASNNLGVRDEQT